MRFSATIQRKEAKAQETLVYLVTMINGKRRKYSLGVKVKSSEWDKERNKPSCKCILKPFLMKVKQDFLKECERQLSIRGEISIIDIHEFIIKNRTR